MPLCNKQRLLCNRLMVDGLFFFLVSDFDNQILS